MQIFTLLGFHEFMPSSEILSKLEGQMCKSQPWLCVNLLSLLCGYNPDVSGLSVAFVGGGNLMAV